MKESTNPRHVDVLEPGHFAAAQRLAESKSETPAPAPAPAPAPVVHTKTPKDLPLTDAQRIVYEAQIAAGTGRLLAYQYAIESAE